MRLWKTCAILSADIWTNTTISQNRDGQSIPEPDRKRERENHRERQGINHGNCDHGWYILYLFKFSRET